jgi:hypothetical protein
LARDHYVRIDSNDYSIHPGVIGDQPPVADRADAVQIDTRRTRALIAQPALQLGVEVRRRDE